MATTTFPRGKRPLIQYFDDTHHTWENPLAPITLVSINSKSAVFRSPHVVGPLGADRDGIRPAVNTIIRVTGGLWAGFLAKVTGHDERDVIAEPFGSNEPVTLNPTGFDYIHQTPLPAPADTNHS